MAGRRVWGLGAGFGGEVENDPLGQEVGTYDPPPDSVGDVGRYPEPHEFGNADDPGAGCTIDGITAPCSFTLRFLNSGAAQRCPTGNCGAQAVTVQALGPDGRVLGAQTVLRLPGQAGWGGELDGTYRVGAFRLGVVNVANGAATSGFLDTLAGILHHFGDHNEYLYRVGGASDSQNYAQDRSDLKIDRDVFKNKKAPKPPGLPDCVKNYLSKFFDRSLLDAITWGHGIPWYVPMDAAAFTLDDHIYFGDGAYNPLNGISSDEIELIGHEVTHSRQYRQNGSLRQKGRYLVESAKNGVVGAIQGGAGLGFALSYFGNKYEKEASDMEKKIRNDLLKNSNPCP